MAEFPLAGGKEACSSFVLLESRVSASVVRGRFGYQQRRIAPALSPKLPRRLRRSAKADQPSTYLSPLKRWPILLDGPLGSPPVDVGEKDLPEGGRLPGETLLPR